MFSKIVIFCLYLVYVHAAISKEDLDKCIADAQMSPAEIAQLQDKTQKEMDGNGAADWCDKELCFMLCCAKANGFIRADGSVDLAMLEGKIKPDLEADKKQQVLDCVRKAGKAEKCADMKTMHECVAGAMDAHEMPLMGKPQ